MKTINKPDIRTWFIVYDQDKKYIHYGFVEPNQRMDTGLSNIEMFGVEKQHQDRLKTMGVAIVENDINLKEQINGY